MGINFSFLKFFDLVARQGALGSPMMALGSQEMGESSGLIELFARENGYPNFLRDGRVASLFADRYGITEYNDCDVNGKAVIWLDLNHQLPADLADRSATVLDGGTIEHIFDVAQALTNIHHMTKVGGTIIHITPITWYDHGFYNFNPLLFRSVARANGYHRLAEAFYFQCDPFGRSRSPDPVLYFTYDGQKELSISNEINKISGLDFLPGRSLYLIASRKETDTEFIVPYDIHP
ncbi:MAG: hypothetical protein HQK58_03285 [Deltaproteobacteria bacterium]|nr:hypothetical protein [Deltaproteobacteria bacterium]